MTKAKGKKYADCVMKRSDCGNCALAAGGKDCHGEAVGGEDPAAVQRMAEATSKAAAALGRKGGKAATPKQQAARSANGRKAAAAARNPETRKRQYIGRWSIHIKEFGEGDFRAKFPFAPAAGFVQAAMWETMCAGAGDGAKYRRALQRWRAELDPARDAETTEWRVLPEEE